MTETWSSAYIQFPTSIMGEDSSTQQEVVIVVAAGQVQPVELVIGIHQQHQSRVEEISKRLRMVHNIQDMHE
jgi:hypothetical protein